MQEEQIEDATFEEIDQQPEESAPAMSKMDVVSALKDAVSDGMLTAHRASQIRMEMGIFNSDFTKKKITDAKRKAKRKAQRKARKKGRK